MQISRKYFSFSVFLMVIALTANPAFAQTTYTWNGGTGTWNTAANWTPAGIPASADTAVINIGTVLIQSDVNVGGVKLTVGSLADSAQLNISGLLDWGGGKIEGAGTVKVASGGILKLSGAAEKELNGRTLLTEGSGSWSGTGLLRMRGGAIFQTAAGATFTIQNNSPVRISTGGGSLVNNGTFTKSSGGGLSDVEVPFTNNGTVNVHSGSLQLKGGSTSGGVYNIGAGSLLIFASGAHTLDNVSFSGSGNIQFTDAALSINGGGVNIASGTAAQMSGSGSSIQGSGPVTVNGTFDWNRGTISGSAAFTVSGTLIVSGTNVKNLNGRTLTNNGAINWTGTGNVRLTNNAALNNQAGANFNIQVDAVLDFLSPAGGIFTNAGTVTKSITTGSTVIDVFLENSGIININSGNLTLTRGSNNTGATFNIAAGRAVELNGDVHTVDNISISGSGMMRHLSNTVDMGSGGMSIGANATYEMSGGFLTGSSPLTNNGTFNWSGGIISGGGTISNSNVLNINGGNIKRLEEKTISNTGTVNWSGSGEIRLVNNAVIANQTGALFDIQGDVQLNFFSPAGGVFNNMGTLTKSAGAGIATMDIVTTNTGAVNVNSGTLKFSRGGNSNNTVFNIAAGTFLTLDGATYNMDNVTIDGGGTAQFANAPVIVNGSGISVSASATLALTESSSILQGSGPMIINGNLTWSKGTISDAGSLTLNGFLTLDGISTKTLIAKTLDNFGTINWTGNGPLRLNNNAKLLNKPGAAINVQIGSAMQLLSANGGIFDNAGTLSKNGGADTLVIDVPYTHSGTINVNNGRLRLTETGSSAGAVVNLGAGTSFDFDGTTHALDNVTFNGGGTVLINRDFVNFNGGNSTFSSATTLKIADGIVGGAASLVIDGNLEWQRGTISGSGSVTVNNTLNLSTDNFKALGGKTLFNKGNATWTGAGEIRLQDGAVLNNQVGGIFQIQNNVPVTFVLPTGGSIVNAGTMVKNIGVGTTRFDVNMVNSGILNVQTGTLHLTKTALNTATGTVKGSGILNITSAALTSHGNVDPGASPGKLTLNGNYNQTTTGDLNIELGGLIPGSSYDQLAVSSAATLNGALNVTYTNGFLPSIGDDFVILTSGTRSGEFSSITSPVGGTTFTVNYTPNSVVLHTIRSNVVPNAVNDIVTAGEDVLKNFNVLANDTDGDGDTLTIVSFTQPLHGALAQTGDSTFSYLSALNFFGSDSFRYSVIDGYGGSDTAMVVINILPVNDPPVVSSPIPNITFPEDGNSTLDLDPFATDVDNSSSELNWAATVIQAQALNSARGKPGRGNVEVDPGDLQISIHPQTHVATFTATGDTSGIFTVVYTVSDPGGLSDSDTALVTVTAVADPPVVISPIPDVSYPEDSGTHLVAADLNTVFSDPDPGTVFSFSAVCVNPGIFPSVQGASLSLNSLANYFGSGDVIVSANDGFGRSVVRDTFVVTYTPVNDPPAISAGLPNIAFPVNGSDSLDLDLWVTDVDNNASELAWQARVISAQSGLFEVDTTDLQVIIDPQTHLAIFTATPDSGGFFSVKLTAIDPGGLSDSDTLEVTVYGGGLQPFVISPIPDLSYPEDSGPHIAVADLNTVFFDPDPTHTFSFSAASDNPDISAAAPGVILLLGSSPNYFGSGHIIVYADNGNGVILSDTFQVTITPVNDPPVISGLPDTLSFVANATAQLNVWEFASDVETPDSLLAYAFFASTPSLLRNYNPLSGILTLSAAPGFSGNVTLAIRASDPENASAEDTLLVIVSPAVGIGDPVAEIPLKFALLQNYPNPFNPTTHIEITIAGRGFTELVIYDMLGREIKALVRQELSPGNYQLSWDGRNSAGAAVSSGIYFYRLTSGSFTSIKRMLLLK